MADPICKIAPLPAHTLLFPQVDVDISLVLLITSVFGVFLNANTSLCQRRVQILRGRV